jgi:hypothetical protein
MEMRKKREAFEEKKKVEKNLTRLLSQPRHVEKNATKGPC